MRAHRLTLPHGAWSEWVAGNCEFSIRTATNYIGAAERAIAALGEFGMTPSEADENALGMIRAQLEDMLGCDHLDEKRAALIASIRQHVAPLARPLKLKPRRAPRATGPRGFTAQAAPGVIERLRLTAPEVRQTILDAFRDAGHIFTASRS